MEMTIDTVTKWLGIIRTNLKVFPEVGSDKKIESLDTAISYLDDYQQLMHKYQQIEQIAKKAILPQYAMELVDEIREVIEDGQ